MLIGGDVILNELIEWLDILKGEVFGNLSWGYDFNKFKYENMNDDLVNVVENLIFNSLLRDLLYVVILVIVIVVIIDFDRY